MRGVNLDFFVRNKKRVMRSGGCWQSLSKQQNRIVRRSNIAFTSRTTVVDGTVAMMSGSLMHNTA